MRDALPVGFHGQAHYSAKCTIDISRLDADEAPKMTPERFTQEKMACSVGMAVRKRQ